VPFDAPAGVVTGGGHPSAGGQCVADPRVGLKDNAHQNLYRVTQWEQPSRTVVGAGHVAGGALSVADPRGGPDAAQLHGKYPVTPWDAPARAVIPGNANGAFAVADPRSTRQGKPFMKYPVTAWDSPTRTVIGGDDTGAYAVADPRPGLRRERGDNYLTAGHYGVVDWNEPTGAVSASAGHDNGKWSVADPRQTQPQAEMSPSDYLGSPGGQIALPQPDDKLVCRILSLDGTWHRPFTTLELAALQSYYAPDDFAEHGTLVMDGNSDSAWRERIGNMVPPAAAEAVGEEIGRSLLLSWAGETFQLSSTPIWVRPLAIAIAVQGTGDMA
jgi:site-specific DNA-cytosine methylase